MPLCQILQCSKYHAKIQSFVYPVHLVLSLNCLPTWSYSVSQLTITVLYLGPKCTKCRRLIIAFHRTQTENLYLLHILIGKYPTWTGLPYHKQLSFTKGHQAKAARGHATPRSLCIDGVVRSVEWFSMWNTVYGKTTNIQQKALWQQDNNIGST